MAERVYIFDTTLRDGEQSPGCSMTVREKVVMARKLAELGVDIIEAGFPIASDGDFDAVQAIARDCRGPRIAGLARAAAGDIERAARALDGAGRARIHTFIATSEIHRKYKLRKSKAQVLADAVAAVERARALVDDVEFSAEDATRTEPDYLEEVARATVAAGARTFNIPDTVGYSTPDEFSALVARIFRAIGREAVVSVHCHNDLGLAVANSLAAVQAGARQVECTVNGIGERAGNCSLEEIVMILKVRGDRLPYHTLVNTPHLYPASQRLTEIISFGPQPNKAVVGRNAFAHEAGIHQDGILKERTTYEIMDPKAVGVPESRLVLGKHSGRHALGERCTALGYGLSRQELETVYQLFTALADRKKGVTDEEILRLVRMEVGRRTDAAPPLDASSRSEQPWI